MVREVYENVLSLPSGPDTVGAERIISDLAAFDIDPVKLYARLPEGPTLLGEGSGTHFVIVPAEDTLADDIDTQGGDDAAPPRIKVLVGFANTMTPGHPEPTSAASFRDHLMDGTVRERIAGSVFFSPEEFNQADHHVRGEFDEFGQFRGWVKVYGSEPVEYLLPWPEAKGSALLCGPLSISFAYVQGEARATKLAPEDHARLVAKLNKIGGLYIYRDGIRVLPYGNSDYDFLNIERRRTKSASYYFFSYRRIFGVIDITRDRNPHLVEKAGREGFRENRAYRQLKHLLENFFVQLAGEFFREGGLLADEFLDTRDDLERNELLRRKRARRVRVRRAEFLKRLNRFFEGVHERQPEFLVADVLEGAKRRLDTLARGTGAEASDLFLKAEGSIRTELRQIDHAYWIPRPHGFGLTRSLRRDWDAYRTERARLEKEVLRPASLDLGRIVSRHATEMGAHVDHRRRLSNVLRTTSRVERRKTVALQRATREELTKLQDRALARAREGLVAVERAVRQTLSNFEATDTSALNDTEFEALRTQLEDGVTTVAELERSNLERLLEQLRIAATDEGLEDAATTDALEEEVEALREKESAELHLAQLGMALSIVHHEFASTIVGVRNSLRRLKPWADVNRALVPVYREIRTNFDHLDGYLSLFTPLDKRLHRKRIRILGTEIEEFLADLFADRLERHDIQMLATDAFRKAGIVGFPSSFYPCFVNLVDNAIFWVGSKGQRDKREIRLDAEGESLLVEDSGPGIAARDAEAVFEMGFTRKPGGRGMGLYISRQTLERNGYSLSLDRSPAGAGARFRIAPNTATNAKIEPQ